MPSPRSPRERRRRRRAGPGGTRPRPDGAPARAKTAGGRERAPRPCERRSGEHALIADRPQSVAGGQGLRFSFLCNDFRYAAHRAGAALVPVDVAVDVEIGGAGNVVGVRVGVDAREQRERVAALLDGAVEDSTIVRAVIRGAPVDVTVA